MVDSKVTHRVHLGKPELCILILCQTKLLNVTESISSKLSYFTELENIGSKMTSLSVSGDRKDALLSTLTKLDQCILFIEKNSHYKESSLYLARFKQHLSRALSTIKESVITTLKMATNDVRPKQGVGEVVTENSYSQFYGKFRTKAPDIKDLMKEIEERSAKVSEYKTLLADCHQCYVSQRGLLLTPTVTASLEELKKARGSDNSGLVRSSCNVICRVCQDEYQLFFHFFTTESSYLNGLLESLCYTLYDALRPILVHTNHLETLADLCTIFKVEMLEERVEPKGRELAAFGAVVKQMLEDVQQRLTFKAQLYIQREIRGYAPAAGDLAYPDKLLVTVDLMQDTDRTHTDSDSVFAASGTESDVQGEAQSPGGSQRKRGRAKKQAAVDMHDMWYPTVRRTLLCLSKLSRCLEKLVFEGIAHEALAECVQSLQFASDSIKAKKPPRDAQLFLIKHLLILREQIAAFDVNFAMTEVTLDWTRTKTAAYGLLQKKSRLFSLNGNNAFLEFFIEGAPEIVETHFDSKKEVDTRLKKVCERFISDTHTALTAPLKALLSRMEVILQLSAKDSLDPHTLLHQQPFAAAEEVHKVIVEEQKVLKSQVPLMCRSLSLYLASEETEHILFRPCRANVLQAYEDLEKLVSKFYSSEDQYIISCPSQDQVSLLLTNLQTK